MTYWSEQSAAEAGFCRVTSLALLRHISNPRIMGPDVVTGKRAWAVYHAWLGVSGVIVLPEPGGLDAILAEWSVTMDLRSSRWTDAYLAAFAVAGGHRLVAFDADFERFQGLDLFRLTV